MVKFWNKPAFARNGQILKEACFVKKWSNFESLLWQEMVKYWKKPALAKLQVPQDQNVRWALLHCPRTMVRTEQWPVNVARMQWNRNLWIYIVSITRRPSQFLQTRWPGDHPTQTHSWPCFGRPCLDPVTQPFGFLSVHLHMVAYPLVDYGAHLGPWLHTDMYL